MVRRITIQEAQQNILAVLGAVQSTKEAVIVEREGKPLAVIVSTEEYEQIERVRERGWAAIDAIRASNADKDPDEVLRDVTEVVEAVRQERYEQSQRAAKGRH